MISEPLSDPVATQVLLRQIQFAWNALGKKNGQDDPMREIISEWNAQTGEITHTSGVRERPFGFYPKPKELKPKLSGKSFAHIPLFYELMASYDEKGRKKALSDLAYWGKLLADGELEGMVFFSLGIFLFRENNAGAIDNYAHVMLRASQSGHGTSEAPAHFAATASSDAPSHTLEMIKSLGFDSAFKEKLHQMDPNALNFMEPEEQPEMALGRIDGGPQYLSTLDFFRHELAKAPDTRIYVQSCVMGPWLLRDDPSNPELLACEATQKKKADRLMKSIVGLESERKWNTRIVSNSERAVCGALWDRRGSILEHCPTKLVVTLLRSGRKSYKLTLHYSEGFYQVEIPGLDVDSPEGRIIAGWDVSFT